MFGYALLGTTWLILKSEGYIQAWAYKLTTPLLIAVLVIFAIISVWTPLVNDVVWERWFGHLHVIWILPALTLLCMFGVFWSVRRQRELLPFMATLGMFLFTYLGLVVSKWPWIVPPNYTIWDAASAPESQLFLLIGVLFVLPFVLGYTFWSYWVFRGKVRAGEGYHQRMGESPGKRTPRGWLAAHGAKQQGRLALAWLGGVAAGAATVAQLAWLAWIISRLLVDGAELASLSRAFLAIVSLLLVRALAQWGQEVAGQQASLRIRHAVRRELLAHLAALGPVRAGERHSASLASQLVEQVEALDGYFARFLPQLRLAVAIPLLILAVVFWLDWLAALFLLLSAPLIPLFMALVGMGAERLNRDQFAAVSRLAGHFLDRVRGIATLQLFHRTREATADVHLAADHYRRLSMRTLRVAFLSSAVLEFFASVAIAVVAIYVGFGLLGYIDYGPSEALTLFSGLLVLLLAPEFFQPLRTLAQHYHDRAAALGAADGLLAFLNETPRANPAAAVTLAAPGPLLRLSEITLEHPGRGACLARSAW